MSDLTYLLTRLILSKEPCILSKEPYVLSKEPYIPSRELFDRMQGSVETPIEISESRLHVCDMAHAYV
jgi:hypothetical protein